MHSISSVSNAPLSSVCISVHTCVCKKNMYTHRFDDNFASEVIDLLKVEVVFEIPVNWLQFLVHITVRVVADVLETQSMT